MIPPVESAGHPRAAGEWSLADGWSATEMMEWVLPPHGPKFHGLLLRIPADRPVRAGFVRGGFWAEEGFTSKREIEVGLTKNGWRVSLLPPRSCATGPENCKKGARAPWRRSKGDHALPPQSNYAYLVYWSLSEGSTEAGRRTELMAELGVRRQPRPTNAAWRKQYQSRWPRLEFVTCDLGDGGGKFGGSCVTGTECARCNFKPSRRVGTIVKYSDSCRGRARGFYV